MFMSILLLLISTSTGLSLSKRDQEADEYKEVRFPSEALIQSSMDRSAQTLTRNSKNFSKLLPVKSKA